MNTKKLFVLAMLVALPLAVFSGGNFAKKPKENICEKLSSETGEVYQYGEGVIETLSHLTPPTCSPPPIGYERRCIGDMTRVLVKIKLSREVGKDFFIGPLKENYSGILPEIQIGEKYQFCFVSFTPSKTELLVINPETINPL